MDNLDGFDIALIISDLGEGGAQRVVSLLANHWVETGFKVVVITQAGPDEDFFRLSPLVRRIVAGGLGASPSVAHRLVHNFVGIMKLRRAIRAAAAPVVVAFVGRTAVRAVLAAAGLAIRLIVCERNDPARQSLGAPWDFLRRRLYRRADIVTANSHTAIAALSAYVPAAKLAYLPNPIAPPAETPGGAVAAKESSGFLNVGRLDRQKAHDVLLEAFARVGDVTSGWPLTIVGEGPQRELLLLQARDLAISESIAWPGRVGDPFPYYRAAEVFVLPSRFEGLPNALLEAMSCGLACIVSDAAGGALEFVEDEISGLVVRSEDPAALAHAMARLAGDAELRKRLGEAGKLRVQAELGLDRVGALWAEVLEIEPNRRKPAPPIRKPS